MPSFEDAWTFASKSRDGESASPRLKSLLRETYVQILRRPKNLSGLKNFLHAVRQYLAGPGRTDANCWAVDRFFMFGEKWERHWAAEQPPDDLHNVVAKMCEALHDAVKAPDIAENFGCFPEQLLEELKHIDITE